MVQIKSMTYSQKMLAKIGRIVIKQHPDIATGIIEQWPKPSDYDLAKIPEYFLTYCQEINAEPDEIKKAPYDYSISEIKKVFICAMVCIYREPYMFKKVVSNTVGQFHSQTSKIIDEVKFRYDRDSDFTHKVDKIINKLKSVA